MANKPSEKYTPGERVSVGGRLGRVAPPEAQKVGETIPVDLDDGSRIDAETRDIVRLEQKPEPEPEPPRRARKE